MLFKLNLFETSCSQTEVKEPGTTTMVTHEHNKRIGRCHFDDLNDITYDTPTLQATCWAPLAANLSIMSIYNRLKCLTKCDASKFNRSCPFIRDLGLDLHDNGLVIPPDEFTNIGSDLIAALITAGPGSHLKVVTMESDLYVYSSVNNQKQFIENIKNLHLPLTKLITGVTKLSISHPKKSLRDPSIGDSLKLLTMRLRQRTCSICHADTDDVLSERRIMCLPCSHLYHEDCISLWLMRKSSCPLCGYHICFDEVECEFLRGSPRRHRRIGPNMFKITQRFAYGIQGSCHPFLLLLLVAVMIEPTIIYLDAYKRTRVAVREDREKGLLKKLLSTVLNYCKDSFKQNSDMFRPDLV